ncbi:Transposase for transposon Tn5 [Symmachiella dynata]|uniref:IS4 family transposase n=1 Tax=Symmachiella dynata TaxID=2527995 RepID=UPI001189B655|nr:IS4 family transposase [Symmachiella dynata]QDT47145.1 Transposase for transposon Tn5 [Symmachiella dynata]
MCHGICHELQGIDLGDKRLNQRSKSILEKLAADPQASINAACSGWNETIAAYRFFDNPAVTPQRLLEPHIEATKQRISQEPVVLIVQDTTELDFSTHPPADAKHLNTQNRLGLYDHTHLAVTPQRLPLGIVGVEEFDRTPESLGKTRERKSLPIEQKESYRWLSGYRLASHLAAENPNAQIVNIADCEADIYDIFLEAEQHPTPAHFVIRAKENRSTPQRDPDSGPAAYCKVRDEVCASPLRTTRTIALPQTPRREARHAELEIRALRITVKPPHTRSSLPTVTYNVVLVEEVNGPRDETDVSWLLLTTLPIDSVDAILRVIDNYVSRWTIEIYFRTLKTGCRVEDIQLETLQRLRNCLALYRIIAWRVLWLTYLNRECPGLPCSVVFAECEWKSVWRVSTKQKLPPTPPPLSEFMDLLAQLGGYNNRQSDSPPGPQTIWTGIRRMTDFAIAWLNFGPSG